MISFIAIVWAIGFAIMLTSLVYATVDVEDSIYTIIIGTLDSFILAVLWPFSLAYMIYTWDE